MAYVITERCVGVKDGACREVCPVDCIFGGPDDPQLYIDPTECIDCQNCASACPVGAIFHEDEVPERWSGSIAVNATARRPTG